MTRKRLPILFATSDMQAGHLEALIARTNAKAPGNGHSANHSLERII